MSIKWSTSLLGTVVIDGPYKNRVVTIAAKQRGESPHLHFYYVGSILMDGGLVTLVEGESVELCQYLLANLFGNR